MKSQIRHLKSDFFKYFLTTLAIVFVLTGSSVFATDVCGSISVNTTWTTAGSPYILTCDVTVASGKTLTINAGVTVKSNATFSLIVNGTLSAVGTSGSPIAITTNNGTPAPGQWGGLRFGSGAGPSASQVTYVTVSYAGNLSSFPSGIYVNGSSPTFNNVTVNFSSRSGVQITGSAATPSFTNVTVSNNTIYGINLVSSGGINITNSAISNNTDYAFGADANTRLIGLTGLTISGNGSGSKNSIGYRGGSITTNETWLASVIRTVTATTTIASAGVLTINAGTTVKFASNTGIDVTGKIIANGTSGNLITFTSNATTPAPGNWNYIKFNSGANPSASQISYATISYAGQNASFPGAIYVNGSSPTFSNLTVSYSLKSGITVSGATATPSVTTATLTNNTLYGANVVSSGGINLTNSTISNNTDYAIGAEAKTRLLGLTGLTMTGNGGGNKNSIGYRGGSITATETWLPTVVWTVTAVTTISSTGTLTVNAGTTVKFATNTGIDVAGKLTAIGTSGSPIVFTSNATTPGPGNWRAIRFRPGSSSLSQVSYATISYGGASYSADVHIDNCSPTLSNITASYSSGSGIVVTTSGSNATISNSALANNAFYGMNLISGGGASLSTTVISNNGDYAVYVSFTARLSGLTGLTLTGNAAGTKDMIAYEGRNITTNEILGGGIVSLLMGDFYIEQTGSLTIGAGATIKLSGVSMQILGKLTATGTATSRIVFTSPNITPSPGDWPGILFLPNSDPTSVISFATISYGGGGWGAALNIDGASPKIDHVNILYSSSGAFDVNGVSVPTITNCSFIGNTGGLSNLDPINVFTANLNYWNSSSGPSGAGPGSGQPVSNKIIYDPWLLTTPSDSHYFQAASLSKPVFNPLVGQTTTIHLETNLSGNWAVKIYDINAVLVRNFSGTGASANIVWDGKNNSAQPLPVGGYTYELESTSGSYTATKAHGIVSIGVLAVIKTLTATPSYFTPNGDQVNDTTTVSATFNYASASWTLNIRNDLNTIVFSVSNTGSSMSYVWDGKNSIQVLQPDGVYKMELVASAEGEQTTKSVGVTLDTSGRTTYILSPYAGEVLSNVYGWFKDIVGTVGDANLDHWTLEIGSGSSPSSWSELTSGTTNVTNQTLYSFPVNDYPAGTYSLRLTATHLDQSESNHKIVVTIANFKAESNKYQINRGTGESVTITSTIPFALNEVLVIKDKNGQVIKTLFNGQRAAGIYTDTWNGLNSQNQMVPDDLNYFTATVASDSNVLYWGDASDPILTDFEYFTWPRTGTFDPFNNDPLDLQYTFLYPGKQMYFVFATECTCDSWDNCHTETNDCNPPNYCIPLDGYREAATRTFYWTGTDQQGRLIKGLVCGWGVIRLKANNWNMITTYGTRPEITNVQVNPPLYAPAVGTQTVSFNFSTYQNQTATITIEFLNQDSLSKLRTITLNNVSPGNFSVGWDGRAGNGIWVAPGHYTVIVKVVDSIGNAAVESRTLTTIQY